MGTYKVHISTFIEEVKAMAESMRGTRLGSSSYEVDKGLRVPVQLTTYVCSEDHRMTFPFYIDADEVPDTWTCECGATAIRIGADVVVPEPPRGRRSHYEILRERREVSDLANVLHERLSAIRHNSDAQTA